MTQNIGQGGLRLLPLKFDDGSDALMISNFQLSLPISCPPLCGSKSVMAFPTQRYQVIHRFVCQSVVPREPMMDFKSFCRSAVSTSKVIKLNSFQTLDSPRGTFEIRPIAMIEGIDIHSYAKPCRGVTSSDMLRIDTPGPALLRNVNPKPCVATTSPARVRHVLPRPDAPWRDLQRSAELSQALQQFPSSRFFTHKEANRCCLAETKCFSQQVKQANIFLTKREARARFLLIRHTVIVA
jgi:hypothetical protein